MASPHGHQTQTQQSTNETDQIFLITLTNHPTLLQNTLHFQQAPDVQYIEQRNGGMFMSDRPVNIGMDHSEQHERFLYNELRFELEDSIRVYHQRTRRSFPINSDIEEIDVSDLPNIDRLETQHHVDHNNNNNNNDDDDDDDDDD
ncbi:unnamed protein product [Rotaria socialis]|uniref:Uncharacterized protein n=1 Tax=Rotaria socialis TaxID=392032 RepID=A0A821S2X2_9BILA|nr:unnamed protein product [Rotaria socialis]